MKIAIHHRKDSFSEQWISYCNENNIDYKIVNAYDNNILQQVEDCDAFMWHFYHNNHEDKLFARQLLYAIQQSGKKVFPDYRTCWHFDDKIGQKYLFEAMNIPHVPTYIFYTKKKALHWAKTITYPKVFKLSSGAGSSQVRLIKDFAKNKNVINQAFSKGFSSYNSIHEFRERLSKHTRHTGIMNLVKGLGRLFIKPSYVQMMHTEKGYVYYQDFIKDNRFDIRIIVIGEKAFGIKRLNRDNDFRASGSGKIRYDKEGIPESCVKAAFTINESLKTQCLACDFLLQDEIPLLNEISFGFHQAGYKPCEGYWDRSITWQKGTFNPYGWMVENLLC